MTESDRSWVNSLSAKTGIDEIYVTVAVAKAQRLIGEGRDQATAAQEGADQAATRAAIEGAPLTRDQQSALREGLAEMFMQPLPGLSWVKPSRAARAASV
jgi:hypothetical protein